MPPAQAHALRRAASCGAAIGAALAAHMVGTGAGALTVRTPFMAGFAMLLAVLVGRRTTAFRPRSARQVLMMLILVQAAAHLVMSSAPWIVGLSAHCPAGHLTPAMLATHLTATILLAIVLTRLERLLAATMVMVRAIRRALSARPPRAPHPALIATGDIIAPAAWRRCASPTRGPPGVVLT